MPIYLKKAKERPAEDLSQVRETVRQIIEKVRQEGEDAVRYYSEKFELTNTAVNLQTRSIPNERTH